MDEADDGVVSVCGDRGVDGDHLQNKIHKQANTNHILLGQPKKFRVKQRYQIPSAELFDCGM